ncbi:multicopper oxidase domain-containing protein [Gramella sp. AN32]|uniref:Multicopper oxidase domain-containing protein n=1 Tax=Christiangramia antarctica TaxID=2058158 RepID=A0ABW5X3R9_9FLAO|nr:multicopper oxidase domain-containing protein [Gramella sp. AN32]MCM4156628.1 copper oxidase [Gramella sp. AN32]
MKKYIFLVLTMCSMMISYGQRHMEKSVEGNINNLPVHEYNLTIDQEKVIKAEGKEVMGMTINGGIPGPTLEFTEGEYAVIYVENKMDVETSIHWHGMILPNFFDGVPYLTTPPIKPGETFKYEFEIKQHGTYWYHSHTMLQEQSGVYGSLLIHPKEKVLEYDQDLVLVLSDWTNEKPKDVLRFLKRGTEWYNIKKGTATPLNQVIKRGAFGAQVDFWRQRMEGADIADIYYPAFLINGEEKLEYPEFQPGEKVRLRIIDGAASTSFWMTFGGDMPTLVSADGVDVVPIKRNKTFIAVAETYDFIVTIPEDGKMEFKIMAQDGSGTASAFLGSGRVLPAPDVARPDKIAMMQKMAKMKMKMGAPALKFNPKNVDPYEMKEKWGMQMDEMNPPAEGVGMEGMDHGGMNMKKEENMPGMDHSKMDMKQDSVMTKMDHSKMDHNQMGMKKDTMKMADSKKGNMQMDKMKGMNQDEMHGMDLSAGEAGMFSQYNYDYLRSPEKTNYDKDIPVTDILLNLTGNMSRYVWSLNGVPLSESDKIKIKGDEVTRITFNNLTMMHHPMHLHGHFFRVINENGEYSPLKHTVNVPPMQEVTIEFYGNEYGDWFFHCHILYHMDAGMARIVSYDTKRDERMKRYPVSKLVKETNKFYTWGMLDAASHMTELNVVSSNIRNQFTALAEYGWNQNIEAEFSYEYYLNDWVRLFGGVNVENEMEDSMEELSTTAIGGIRYFTPYMFALDVRLDSKLRPQVSLAREIMIFPKLAIFGTYEFQADFGWVDELPEGEDFVKEETWSAGLEYFLGKNFSLMGSYDNRFGAGGGLSLRF